MNCGKKAVLIVALAVGGFSPLYSFAQTTDNRAKPVTDNNPSETNLEETAEPVRRIQRLGDVVGENEWELELSVPQALGELPIVARLPDENQQQELTSLLTRLASNPQDQAALENLNALMNDILRQANAAIDANQLEQAANILAVVRAVTPKHPGIPTAQSRLEALSETQGQLGAARKAMQDGRIDQPENNSAWFFYRQVLDQYPGQLEAQQGLLEVQQDMLARSIAFAEGLDFDSAERLLEDATFVREEQDLVEQASREINKIKTRRAELLETQAVQAMDSGDFKGAEKALIKLVALGGQGDRVNQLRRRMEEARIYGGFRPGQVIRDHFMTVAIWAPEAVVILAGSYLMGSTIDEPGRTDNESPQHRVTIRRGFAIGKREVSVEEFRVFAAKSGYKTDAQRSGSSTVYDPYSGRLTEKDGVFWEMDFEGKPSKPNDPVVHVSWNDAQAYLSWLGRGTGKLYRLPSEAEFEYALRGGTNTRYWWGDHSPSSVVENITGDGDISRTRRRWTVGFTGYTDKYWGPSPVGSFQPNPFGLLDIGGNVGEWVRDCWHDTYIRAPSDGSAWINPGCEQHVIRGGFWAGAPDQTRSAFRLFSKPNHHDARLGFRVARDL